ncbi:MAG: flagellar type III secretion system protein FlhB [Rhodobacter sp.]|nr:flagellar type III secretion system protein FlhB [Rhodobacter sp.]
MSEDESGEKSHEPTQKKLDDARKKGEFPKSVDLTTAAVYGGLLLAAIALGKTSVAAFGTAMSSLLDQADTLSTLWFQGSGTPLSAGLIGVLGLPLLGWFGVPALAAFLTIVAQRAFVVAPDKLQAKLNRISPLSNAKNKFGRAGLFEFAKSFVKLSLYSVVLALFLLRRLPEIIATASFTPAVALTVLADLALDFLAIVLVIALAIGAVDFLWQQQEHLRKNMMSRKELTDEAKQSEGDPHLKQQRRQRGYEIAMNTMLADVPDADVIVVNPQHYAVALKWSRATGAAPECVAKGVDEIAARIREIAAESGVPIHRDPPTARALYASVRIGQEILPVHYQAVAAAIRFAEAMQAKAKERKR